MPEGQLLEFSAVTKRFGAVTAVDGFTARVEPGRVTGFLGPNGAGKTTTLRILLGLVRATEGGATIGGVPYAKLKNPLQTVGAVLEASSFHPGRTAANHLKVYAQAAGLPGARVDEALGLVGLADVAGRKVGGYSLGMRQRLGLAYALVGDPGVRVLDEPANGLDPEGIKWMRGLLRELARQGRTVLVSSHLLAEVQQTVDSLLIISAGRLVFEGGLDELADPTESATVVDARDRPALSAALRDAHVEVEVLRSGLTVRGLEPAEVGQIAADAGIALSSLHRRGPALEEVFLDLVNGTRVHSPVGAVPVADSGADAPGAAAGAAAAAVAVAVAVEEEEPGAAAEAEGETVVAPEAKVAAGAAAVVGPEVEVAEAAPEAEVAGVVELAAVAPVAETAADGEPVAEDRSESESESESEAEPGPDAEGETDAEATGPASFAVASTGVIDIIPPAGDETPSADASLVHEAAATADDGADATAGTDGITEETLVVDDDGAADDDFSGGVLDDEPVTATEEWASVAPSEDQDVDQIEPAEPEPADREDTAAAEWDSVAPASPDGGRADSADPDGGQADSADADAGQADSADPDGGGGTDSPDDPQEESTEPPAEVSDRPWEHYAKTDADVEADRFFGAFDENEPRTDEHSEGGEQR
jgi:ABC-type multidrug transport system ATPase subunit